MKTWQCRTTHQRLKPVQPRQNCSESVVALVNYLPVTDKGALLGMAIII